MFIDRQLQMFCPKNSNLLPLRLHRTSEKTAVLLKNVQCERKDSSCPFGNLFVIDKVPILSTIKNVQLATFFDLYEDASPKFYNNSTFSLVSFFFDYVHVQLIFV